VKVTRVVECPVCGGRGENALPGTYGPTISPENLELIQCWLCVGDGEVIEPVAAYYLEGMSEQP